MKEKTKITSKIENILLRRLPNFFSAEPHRDSKNDRGLFNKNKIINNNK